MAPLMYLSFRKVLLVYLVLFLFNCVLVPASSSEANHDGGGGDDDGVLQFHSKLFVGGRRRLLAMDKDQDLHMPKKKSSTSKNQTKFIKANGMSSKNQTSKLIKSNTSSKNQTKLVKAAATSTTTNSTTASKLSSGSISSSANLSKSKLKRLNSTSSSSSKLSSKANNSPSSSSLKKSLDPLKLSSSKNKTSTKQSQTLVAKKVIGNDLESTSSSSSSSSSSKPRKTTQNKEPIKTKQQKNQKGTQKTTQPSWLDQDDSADDDLVSEFRDIPIKFQQTLIPDLERISTTSKAYINKYNKEIAKGFKPYVGNKYAATIASIVSFAFILIPLILVSLIVNRIKAYFSLQKILIFIQVYLSIYFSILCLSSLVTGLEPLRFFYATSRSTYVCLQVLQTLGYVLYLLLLLMYLILVFSTECGLGSKMLGLAQAFVGCAVGLHYYVAVFHRVVLHQPPRTNWKVHGIYATCFLVICLLANAERRKKAYLEEGGEEGKKN